MHEVCIIIDPEREGEPNPGALVVESERDYFAARVRLRAVEPGAPPLVIWVRSPALAHYFDDLRADPRVELKHYDPRQELAARLGTEAIPELITPEMIRSCDLLQKATECKRHEGESVLAWCCRVSLGEAWATPRPDPDDLPAVLSSLIKHEKAELLEFVSWRFTVWAAASEQGELWNWLAEDPFSRTRAFLASLAVRRYDKWALQWLTQAGFEADLARKALSLAERLGGHAPIPGGALPPVIQQELQHELEANLRKNGPVAVQAAPAHTEAEQRAVLAYLRERAERGQLLSSAEAEALTTWSRDGAAEELAQQIALAAQLLTERPSATALPETADWEQVRHWLESEYLPTYVCRAVGGRLEETAEAVQSFENWICDRYRPLMEQPEVGLHWFCPQAKDQAEQALVVLVLLDGVPFLGGQWLRAELAEEPAVTVVSERPYLAPVPTLTSISKPVLLSARLPDQAKDLEVEALADSFGVRQESCRVVERIEDIGLLFPQQVVLWHYRSVEELLHKPMSALERWLQCHYLLGELAQSLRSLLGRAQREGVPLWLGCVSDHGWTELPPSARCVEVPEKLVKDPKNRRVVHGVANEAYGLVLRERDYFLRSNFTVARGYTCFGRRPQGAAHGGLTPQEMIVYGFWITTVPVAPINDLELRLEGEIRRAVARNNATLRIRNPNAELVTVTEIDLDTVAVEAERLRLDIKPGAVAQLPVICDASKCTDMLGVVGSISWHTQSGRRHRQQVDFQMPTTGAAEIDKEFESMFNV